MTRKIHETEEIKPETTTRTSTPSDSSPVPPQQEYKCPLCQETMGTQKEFTQHIRAHNEVKPSPDPNDPTGQSKVYYCCMCRKMLSSFSSLDRHMLVHSGERPFSCEKCGQTFTTNGNMHRHKRTHGSRDSRESDISSGGSATSAQTQKTPRGPNGPGRKRKPSVDTLPTNTGSLEKSTGHAKCPICPESFFSELSLESHMSVHQGVTIPCDECPMTFPSYTYFKLHKNMYHPNGTSTNNGSAGFPFRNAFQLAVFNQNLQDKVKKEEKVLDLSSPVKIPEKRSTTPKINFTSIETLTSTTTASNEDPNENNADDNDHEIREMKLKGEFPCRLCDAVFPNLRALKGHNKEHMDRPPYICNVGHCTYSSNDKSTLARHMRTHTGEKPFECTICNFGFTTKANCERHVKNKHGKATREEVRDSIMIHESTEESEKNLNTSMTESNDSREEDLASPIKRRRNESGIGSSNERIFAPYRSNLYKPKDQVKQDAPLDLSRPNTGDSLKENLKEASVPAPPPPAAAMPGMLGFPGFNPLLLNLAASAPGSFDWASYLIAYQQQEALRRQREAEMNDPTALLLHLSKLQSMNQNPLATAPLATSPEKIEKTIEADSKSSEEDYKMVIKNGVLMKKQKQRRYRTERPHECEHCNARFTLRSNMDRHIKQQHSNEAKTECSNEDTELIIDDDQPEVGIEGAETNNNFYEGDASSENDEKKPHPEEGFKCYLCEDGQSTKEDALKHLQNAHPEDYASLCAKGAFEECTSLPPEETHEFPERGQFPDYANRRVICLFCMRKFWSAEDLRRHVRTHTGEKPYECDICHRKFTLKHSMLRHRKKHDSGVSSGEASEDTDSESGVSHGGHSSMSSVGRSSPEDGAKGEPLLKKKKPSLMDKINQLSTAAAGIVPN